MASQQQEPLTPKQQVLHDLEHARASLAHHASHAAEEWSPKAIFTRSLQKHRAVWMGAAAIAGLAVLKSLWPSRSSHRLHENISSGARSSGWMALLLTPLIGLARKAVMNYGAQWVQSYLHQKISPNAPDTGEV